MNYPFTYTLSYSTVENSITIKTNIFLCDIGASRTTALKVGCRRRVVIRYCCCYCLGSPCVHVSSHLAYMHVDNLLKASTF